MQKYVKLNKILASLDHSETSFSKNACFWQRLTDRRWWIWFFMWHRERWSLVSTGWLRSLPRTFVLCSQTAIDTTRPAAMSSAWPGSCRCRISLLPNSLITSSWVVAVLILGRIRKEYSTETDWQVALNFMVDSQMRENQHWCSKCVIYCYLPVLSRHVHLLRRQIKQLTNQLL